MKINESWTYAAPADRVYAMVIDPRFQDAKCAATDAVQHSVDVHADGDNQVVRTSRTMSTEQFPDQFKKMIGPSLEIVENQLWHAADASGARTADLNVEVQGAPVALTGTITMTPAGEATDMAFVGDLKARIPLFGGKIEQAAAPAIVAAIQIEHETGEKYLAGS